MKKFLPFIILIAALCSLAPAFVSAPPNVNIHSVAQDAYYQPINAKTNIVGATTNFTVAFKSTTTNFTMNADSLLALLENSFHTNFPAGCQLLLMYQGGPLYGFIVSDSTGTNFGFDPYQVLNTSFLSGTAFVASGAEIKTATNTPEDHVVGKDAESFTTALNYTYDDFAMTNTVDGTHTRFTWTGLVHNKSSVNLSNEFFNETISIDVIGSGSVRGQSAAVFTGTINAKMAIRAD